MENIEERVRQILINASEKDIDLVDDNAELIKDLGFDSVKTINLIVALEEEFNIEFEDMLSFITKFNRVKEFVEYVVEYINNERNESV